MLSKLSQANWCFPVLCINCTRPARMVNKTVVVVVVTIVVVLYDSYILLSARHFLTRNCQSWLSFPFFFLFYWQIVFSQILSYSILIYFIFHFHFPYVFLISHCPAMTYRTQSNPKKTLTNQLNNQFETTFDSCQLD